MSKPARKRGARRAAPDFAARDARRERILAELGSPDPEVDELLFAMIAAAGLNRDDTLRDLYGLLDAGTTDMQAMVRAWLYSIFSGSILVDKLTSPLQTPGEGRSATLGVLQRAETLTREIERLPSSLWPLPPFAPSEKLDAVTADTEALRDEWRRTAESLATLVARTHEFLERYRRKGGPIRRGALARYFAGQCCLMLVMFRPGARPSGSATGALCNLTRLAYGIATARPPEKIAVERAVRDAARFYSKRLDRTRHKMTQVALKARARR